MEIGFDIIFYVILIAAGLVWCGYLLGKDAGFTDGTTNTLKELINADLLDVEDLLEHYATHGVKDAQTLLDKIKNKTNSED